MEDNCSINPRNFKEFVQSSWFRKPLIAVVVGSVLGFVLYGLLSNTSTMHNVYGDILTGIVIGLFFTNIPCLNCNSCNN